MNLHLQEKVFLISGGAKGIGEAISRTIAAERGIPVIIDPSEKEGEKLVEEFKEAGINALQIPIRLTHSELAKECVEKAVKAFGRIDGVVNNAGSNDDVGLENGSPESFRASVEKNLGHYFDTMPCPISKNQKEALSISAAKQPLPDKAIQAAISRQKEVNSL